MPRHKRPRGGQPGNQNARKHGIYSANLSLEELQALYNLINQEHLNPATAVLRLKLDFIRRHAPGNKRLMREVSGLLNKVCLSQFNLADLSRQDKAELKEFLRVSKAALFVNNTLGKSSLPEPTEAKS
jgi:hypothetical protein